MSAKAWFKMFIATVLLIASCIVGINLSVDAFGAFGDPIYNWYSANMTSNPKVAKYTYVDMHKGEFESFIVGPSGASGISPSTVYKYTGLTCYNMFNYGADMAYTNKLVEYLADKHKPKRIFLVMPVISATVYDTEITSIAYSQPLKPLWRLEFLFANPKYALDKMKNKKEDSYFQKAFDVFNAETGAYDKTKRDAEAIGDLADYLDVYTEFNDIPQKTSVLKHISENINALNDIKSICEESGIELTVVVPPMHSGEISFYNTLEVSQLYIKMADITEFWSFASSDISDDPRYFYDATHYRNTVGDMMLAKIFNDGSLYYPDNFGQLVTKENAKSAAENIFSTDYKKDNEINFPILMYHHLAEEDAGYTISASNFERHMMALCEEGYNTISMEELYKFAVMGEPLPEKPILITFDDGYLSNYEIAYPILKKNNMKAAIFIIGATFGSNTYKDTDIKITPHFGYIEAKEMVKSGIIEIGSHTFDMHQVSYDENPREGVLRYEDEMEETYIEAFKEDVKKEKALLKEINGFDFFGFAYPSGLYDRESATLLNEMGAKLTLTSDFGRATVVKGIPSSLLQLNRFSIDGELDEERLIDMIKP